MNPDQPLFFVSLFSEIRHPPSAIQRLNAAALLLTRSGQ